MGDRYTRAVLTVIALALVCLVAQNATRSANAQNYGPTHVVVDKVDQFAFQFTTVPVRVER